MEERVSRFRAFWAGENHDRPLVGFTGSYFPRETIELLNTKDGQLHPDGIDVTRFLKHCDVQYAAWNEHTGDMIWSASPLWGLPWLAAILKQTLHVGQTTIWTEPVLEDYGELDALRGIDTRFPSAVATRGACEGDSSGWTIYCPSSLTCRRARRALLSGPSVGSIGTGLPERILANRFLAFSTSGSVESVTSL